MRLIILLLLLLARSGQLYSQQTLIIKDANKAIIGIPVFLKANDVEIDIISQEGNLLSLSQNQGFLFSILNYFLFESDDCSGTGYVSAPFNAVSPRFVEIGYGDNLGKVALLPASPPYVEVEIRSGNYVGCGQYQTPTVLRVINPANYIVDPVIYGFEWSTDLSRWVFPVPFSIEVVKGDAVFCSSFESCPNSE
jgi:hypothetical protein